MTPPVKEQQMSLKKAVITLAVNATTFMIDAGGGPSNDEYV